MLDRIKKKIVIGTHHKTGTNFFLKFLKAVEQEGNVILWDRDASSNARVEPKQWDIYFDHWSKWVIDLNKIDFKGIHSIRHPFSLIYSATLYHLKSDEMWLDKPEEKFGGRSYREMLNSLENFDEQIIFEMKNFSRPVISRMLEVHADKRFVTCRLENISNDPDMTDLENAFKWCGLSSEQTSIYLEIASRFCIWKTGKHSKHMTTGVDETWRDVFKGSVADTYKRLYEGQEVFLGYEKIT